MADQVIDLIKAVEEKSKNVHTSSLDLSFNEILDMKNMDELNISPDFQRLFRWSEGSRSRFIESLLLEMPVPPIYVVEEDEGKYLLIDGLQRISSYLHFRGKLDAPHLETPVKTGDKLTLTDCDIVKELNGKTFDDLGTALQIRLKRAFVRVEVVRKGSDSHFKYHMFKRLNTGGEILSQQQVRNCTIRLLNPAFIDFINELSKNPDFETCTLHLTDEQHLAAFDKELILRFFALKNNRPAFKHDIADFLTEFMEAVSDPNINVEFNYEEEKKIFEKTFKVLTHSLKEKAFGPANKLRNKITAAFGVLQFESITLGIQSVLGSIDLENKDQLDKISTALETLKLTQEFISLTTGGGKNSSGQLKSRIEAVEKALQGI
ncbi:hypothetical protein WSM22_44940 [Cytophagales bacterium WSM2-2]|nr:hypothetical protein WSM22_44940 [Cytophagales bacterium WSM2-2]